MIVGRSPNEITSSAISIEFISGKSFSYLRHGYCFEPGGSRDDKSFSIVKRLYKQVTPATVARVVKSATHVNLLLGFFIQNLDKDGYFILIYVEERARTFKTEQMIDEV